MDCGTLLRNNCPATSCEAQPRSRSIRRRNCDGLSSLSFSFVIACRMRWAFVCVMHSKHSCLKVVNGFGRFQTLDRKSQN
ncbi:hypothetical protein T01_11023 [Trichinella spiralis]|uniref:Uncharacterized protein n=1 Tax=Trichinella spiralis TaxID=6334 RepID=A0A0V1BZG8_TRISP|nr:hypothetical protein T01_11023 [Trichinella spiralis]